MKKKKQQRLHKINMQQHSSSKMQWTHKRFIGSGRLALKIRRFETDQSWRRWCCRCAETTPPQVSVCHLSAVTLEELHRQFFLSNDVKPTNHKTPASCANTTTEAEFSENLHELKSVFVCIKRQFFMTVFFSFFVEIPMQS